MFTERDLDNSYDLEKAVKLILDGNSARCDSDSVIIDDSVITITEEAVYHISGNLDNGMIIVDAENAKLQLILDGVQINNDTSAAIYVKSAEKVFITTAEGSQNSLTSGEEFVNIDDNHIDATIFSKDDITLNGTGRLNITAKSGHGVVSKDDLKITSGVYTIWAGDHGLSGKDSVRIADGDIDISATEDGIHSENEDEEELGYVYIQDGDIHISAGDDGIHAGSSLMVRDGNIQVEKSYEGLEALVIDISGGNILIHSDDDGLNAAGGTDASGIWNDKPDDANNAQVDTGKDKGLDEENINSDNLNQEAPNMEQNDKSQTSDMEQNNEPPAPRGDMPMDNANDMRGVDDFIGRGGGENGGGMMDVSEDAKIIISGGTIFAIGTSQMAENFTSAKNQGTIMLNMNGNLGDDIIILDKDGKELASWTAGIDFQNIVVSCAGIEDGGTYTIQVGTSTESVTMNGLIYK